MGKKYSDLHCVNAGGGYNKLLFGSGTTLHIWFKMVHCITNLQKNKDIKVH